MRKHGFVKYETRLLNDHRFFELSEFEQLTWMKIWAILSITSNKIPKNYSTIRSYLRTFRSETEIESAFYRLKDTFPKFKENKYFWFYQGWNKKFQKKGEQTTVDIDKDIDLDIDKDREKKFRLFFRDEHFKETGIPYDWVYGKDNLLLRSLVRLYDDATLTQLIEEYFKAMKDPECWWRDKAISVGMCKSMVKQITVRLRK